MCYFDSYGNISRLVVDSKQQQPGKSTNLIGPLESGPSSENKPLNLVLTSTPERVDACVDHHKIEEIEESEKNDGEAGQRPTSYFIKALGYFFSGLEDYDFLKNDAYILGLLLPIRNVYHYFRQLKSERPEEILKRINRQTPSLPSLTEEEFGELFKHFLTISEIDKDQGWQLNQQVTDYLKLTRSCCQTLQKQNKKFIEEIINNKHYDKIYDHFLKKNASLEQKKIFLENLITAHHIKEKQQFDQGDRKHYAIDETYRRVEESLRNFNKEKIKEKLTYLIELNHRIEGLSFYSDEEKKIYTVWSRFISSHSWVRNVDILFVKIPTWLKKTPFLTGNWALIFFPVVVTIYFLLSVFFKKKNADFRKESILLAEIDEKSRIENVQQKIVSRRFHFQQMLFLTKEKKVIDLFVGQKIENEKNWVEFSHSYCELMKKIYLMNKANLESDPFSEEELASRKYQSIVYHYVSDVNQETQFWLVALTKGINSIVCVGLLLSCAALFYGPGLATAVALPYVFVVLVLAIFIILLLCHCIDSFRRKQAYQQAITYHLDKKCEYHYLNEQGQWCVREVTQWEKFEYLRKDIQLLEKYVQDTLAMSEENLLSENYKKILNEFLNREGVFEYHYRDKTLEELRSNRSLCEYLLIRTMIFFTGGMYGFSLQYAIGNTFCAKLITGTTLSVLALIFLPLIIVSGIINLLVYSLHKKQEKKLFFLNHFDAKLSALEDRKDSLLCVIATLDTLKKQQESPQQQGLLEDKKANSGQDTVLPLMRENKAIGYMHSPSEFFKHTLANETSDKKASLEIINTQGEDKPPLCLRSL